MEVNCNVCEKDFVIKIKKKKINAKVTETYFQCPYCKEKYHILYTNIHTEKLKKEVEKLFYKMNTKHRTRKMRREYERTKRKLETATKNLYRELGKEKIYLGM